MGEGPPVVPEPFITISRQPGAGAWTLAQQLVDALDADDRGGRSWTCWDRELVEKVAAEHHLSQRLIESLEDANHSWFTDFLGSLSFRDEPTVADADKAYARVAGTIRALAQAGRSVIVGLGGVFLTRRMPGGIHLRLVAPLDYRVNFLARLYGISNDQAAVRARDMERNRHAFYKRHWPNETLAADTFTLTLNTAAIPLAGMIDVVRAVVRQTRLALAAK